MPPACPQSNVEKIGLGVLLTKGFWDMPAIALTDTYIRGLRAPKEGRIEVADTKCPGLSLRVTKNDVKTFSFRYRDKITGKIERLGLGRYPTIALAVARDMADEHRVAVTKGGSPRKEVRRAKAREQAAMTVDKLADKYIAEYVEKKTPRSAATVKSYLNGVRAAWGSRKAKDIERPDVIALLDKRAKTAPVAANRTRTILGTMFGWAVDTEILDTSPMVRIPKPLTEERARDRILNEAEIATLYPALRKLDDAMCFAFRALLLTGQRPGEIVGMMRSELRDLDRDGAALWELPPERTKNKRHHVVPLSKPAVEIVKAALALQNEKAPSPFVFASRQNGAASFDRQSLARALKRLLSGLKPVNGNDEAVSTLQTNNPTPHDFRRTAITEMMRLGIARDTVKAVVNHAFGDVTETNYDRYDRIPEKRAALDAWAARVGDIVDPSPARAANVVPIARAARRKRVR